MGRAGTGTVIFTFGVLGPVIFVGLACLRYRSYLPTIMKEVTVSREHLKVRYTMTNFIAQQFFNMGMRMDLFLLSFYGLKNQVADYGLAQKVILTIISTVVSITQVLSPRFALITRRSQAIYELKKSIKFLAIPTVCFALLMIIPDGVFRALFTGKFVEVGFYTRILGGIFTIFSIGQVFALFHLYTFKNPKVLLTTNIVFFVIMVVGCLTFIPLSGAIAAPATLGIAMGITVLLQAVGFGRKLALMKD